MHRAALLNTRRWAPQWAAAIAADLDDGRVIVRDADGGLWLASELKFYIWEIEQRPRAPGDGNRLLAILVPEYGPVGRMQIPAIDALIMGAIENRAANGGIS